VPREPKVAKECGGLIEAARLANPRITVEEVLKLLQRQHVKVLPSKRTIQKHFARVHPLERTPATVLNFP